MNAKLCKILRRLDEYDWKDARYSHREHHKLVEDSNYSHTVVTSVLLPECGRATYRRAKKYARELKKTPLV